jgi:hypothetical protein
MAGEKKVTSQEPGAEGDNNINAMIVDDFAALVYLKQPEAGKTQETLLAVGDIVRVDFNINDQVIVLENNSLIIEFENGATLVLSNFIELAEKGVAPLLTMPDGAMIPGDILLSALETPPIETAAGESGNWSCVNRAHQFPTMDDVRPEPFNDTENCKEGFYVFFSGALDVVFFYM